jgi:hypothetical protein
MPDFGAGIEAIFVDPDPPGVQGGGMLSRERALD